MKRFRILFLTIVSAFSFISPFVLKAADDYIELTSNEGTVPNTPLSYKISLVGMKKINAANIAMHFQNNSKGIIVIEGENLPWSKASLSEIKLKFRVDGKERNVFRDGPSYMPKFLPDAVIGPGEKLVALYPLNDTYQSLGGLISYAKLNIDWKIDTVCRLRTEVKKMSSEETSKQTETKLPIAIAGSLFTGGSASVPPLPSENEISKCRKVKPKVALRDDVATLRLSHLATTHAPSPTE